MKAVLLPSAMAPTAAVPMIEAALFPLAMTEEEGMLLVVGS